MRCCYTVTVFHSIPMSLQMRLGTEAKATVDLEEGRKKSLPQATVRLRKFYKLQVNMAINNIK